jgi:hypothetical protein
MELSIICIIDMYFFIIIFFSILKAFRIEKPLPLPSENRIYTYHLQLLAILHRHFTPIGTVTTVQRSEKLI